MLLKHKCVRNNHVILFDKFNIIPTRAMIAQQYMPCNVEILRLKGYNEKYNEPVRGQSIPGVWKLWRVRENEGEIARMVLIIIVLILIRKQAEFVSCILLSLVWLNIDTVVKE